MLGDGGQVLLVKRSGGYGPFAQDRRTSTVIVLFLYNILPWFT